MASHDNMMINKNKEQQGEQGEQQHPIASSNDDSTVIEVDIESDGRNHHEIMSETEGHKRPSYTDMELQNKLCQQDSRLAIESKGNQHAEMSKTEECKGPSHTNADLQSRLQEQDPRLGTEQVINVINDLISTQKQTKVNTKILAVGLVATSLIGAASTTYLAIKESRHVETLQTDIKESSISDAVVVQLNNNADDEEGRDAQGRIVVGFVALEDVERSWRDAQKGQTVTSTVTVEDENNNEHLETVFTIDAANAKLQVDANGNKKYSNLATQTGGAFEVGCL